MGDYQDFGRSAAQASGGTPDDYDDPLVVACPRCDRPQRDMDGFGVLYCDRSAGGCGYCTHPSQDLSGGRWVCGLCGAATAAGHALGGEG